MNSTIQSCPKLIRYFSKINIYYPPVWSQSSTWVYSLDVLHLTCFIQFFLVLTPLHHSFNHLNIFGCRVEIMEPPLRHISISQFRYFYLEPKHFRSTSRTFSIQPFSLEEKSKFHSVTVNRKNCRILINGVCRQEEEKITVIFAEV